MVQRLDQLPFYQKVLVPLPTWNIWKPLYLNQWLNAPLRVEMVHRILHKEYIWHANCLDAPSICSCLMIVPMPNWSLNRKFLIHIRGKKECRFLTDIKCFYDNKKIEYYGPNSWFKFQKTMNKIFVAGYSPTQANYPLIFKASCCFERTQNFTCVLGTQYFFRSLLKFKYWSYNVVKLRLNLKLLCWTYRSNTYYFIKLFFLMRILAMWYSINLEWHYFKEAKVSMIVSFSERFLIHCLYGNLVCHV